MSGMLDLIKTLAPQEGYNLTELPGVRILRADRPLARTPVLYDPGIVIVLQGSKRGYFGQQTYLYDEQHYLAVSVPVPFTMETDASATHPLLAIYIHLDFQLAAELILQIDQHKAFSPPAAPQSMMSSQMDASIRQAVLGLLHTLNSPLDTAILGHARLRELYFRVLTGEQGTVMRAALALQGQFSKIGNVVRYIHRAYAEPLTLTQLAGKADMSIPTFHLHFKAVIRMPPMQYVKLVRLHQARMLMVRQHVTAAEAGYAVGYESPSQFTREFKRLFGLPPAAEIKRMQRHFTVPPEQQTTIFVSSH